MSTTIDKEKDRDKDKDTNAVEKRRSAGRERDKATVSAVNQNSSATSAPASSSNAPTPASKDVNIPISSSSSVSPPQMGVQGADERKSPRVKKAELMNNATSSSSQSSPAPSASNPPNNPNTNNSNPNYTNESKLSGSASAVGSKMNRATSPVFGSGSSAPSTKPNDVASSATTSSSSQSGIPSSSGPGSSNSTAQSVSANPLSARKPLTPLDAEGDKSIAKPTNARHVVHVERDATTGALVLVRGDEVVTLTADDALASYAAMLNHVSTQSLVFPPLNSINLSNKPSSSSSNSSNIPTVFNPNENDSDSDDSSDEKYKSKPKEKEKERDREKEKDKVDFKEKDKEDKRVKSPVTVVKNSDPLRSRPDEKDDRFRSTPELTRFSSPYHSQPLTTSNAPKLKSSLELSESDTAESTIEEERRTLAQAKRARRDKLISEFVRTEGIHVEALKSVIVDYVAPLREARFLTAQQQKNLFSNIELLLMWNMDFLQALKDRMARVLGNANDDDEWLNVDERVDDKDVCFGDIIVKSSVILRQLFAQYNQNYALAQLTYQELLKNKDFEQFIAVRPNLLTALYLPIQRMIMYDSLVKEILNLTPPTHADFENITAAYKLLRSMDKAATRVAEKRKNMDLVLRIQNSLLGAWDIAQPHRSHVFEESLLLVVGKALKERTLFLFNDLLLLAKEKRKNKFEVERSVALDKIAIDSYDHDRHLFKISLVSEGESLWFHSENKLTWIQMLRSTQRRLHAPPVEINDLLEEEHDYAADVRSSSFERDVLNAGAMPLTKKYLKAKIVKLAAMEDNEQMAKELRKLAKRILQFEQLQQTHGVNVDDDSDEQSANARKRHHY